MALLEVKDLVKSYADRNVLDGVSFDLEEGEAKVIMGPSGCGKSTLLRCLNLLNEPTSGAILFDGEDVTHRGVDVRALRERLECLDELHAVALHHEVDRVAVGFAPEAIKVLLARIDRERRRLLLMKGTQPFVFAAKSLEFDRLADQLNDVYGLQDTGLAVSAAARCSGHGD
jgi:ABC-type iron transport system FetAB ATPase subunit